MSDIKLGLSGSQTTLPKITWESGSPPELPVEFDKGVQEARMLDGSVRFNLTQHSAGVFTLAWDGITWANVSTLLAVVGLNAQLVYTNQYTDNVNHDVVVMSFSYAAKAGTISHAVPKYTFSMVLKEVV